MLLHLPRLDSFGSAQTMCEPPGAGHDAEGVQTAIASSIGSLPAELRRSPTWGQESEMAQRAQLWIASNLNINYCRT